MYETYQDGVYIVNSVRFENPNYSTELHIRIIFCKGATRLHFPYLNLYLSLFSTSNIISSYLYGFSDPVNLICS